MRCPHARALGTGSAAPIAPAARAIKAGIKSLRRALRMAICFIFAFWVRVFGRAGRLLRGPDTDPSYRTREPGRKFRENAALPRGREQEEGQTMIACQA